MADFYDYGADFDSTAGNWGANDLSNLWGGEQNLLSRAPAPSYTPGMDVNYGGLGDLYGAGGGGGGGFEWMDAYPAMSANWGGGQTRSLQQPLNLPQTMPVDINQQYVLPTDPMQPSDDELRGQGSMNRGGAPAAAVNRQILPQVSREQAEVFKALSGLFAARQGRSAARDMQAAARTANPFGDQRPAYQQLLSQSYTNPRAFLQTPENQLQMKALEEQLERSDAKAGRRSQYGSRAVQLATEQAKLLDRYRQGLMTPSGAGIAPGGTQASLDAARMNLAASAQPFIGLGEIFRNQELERLGIPPAIADMMARPKTPTNTASSSDWANDWLKKYLGQG